MKLKYEFTMMDMGGEIAAVPTGDNAQEFHGILKEDTTPEKVHKYLKEKYADSTDEEIAEILVDFLNRLLREGLLIAP